jgi:hypothetical protein
MQIHTHTLQGNAWSPATRVTEPAQLALVFGSVQQLAEPATWERLKALHPEAHIVACSTAGEILGDSVHDDTLVCTGVRFERSQVALAAVRLDEAEGSTALGALLASRLGPTGLKHVFVLSDGLQVNGSALVDGLRTGLPEGVAITGGLAGDGARFANTAVCLDGPQPSRQVIAIGFCGDALRVGYGCAGGWESFGIERRITHSEGNVLFELDGEPALDLYKKYLGPHAAGLPATGLLFPLAVRPPEGEQHAVVRTILGIDEQARSMTFAGDVPAGFRARLMKSRVESLVDGANGAAGSARALHATVQPQLAILVSCVGRKLVMKQRVEEEVEAVREALGPGTVITGFYSYGELSPQQAGSPCELHNQTMTVTTVAEA